jgi:hypothetical protein
MTTVLSPTTNVIGLTPNDHVVTSGEPRPVLTQYPTPWSMSVNFHVREDTPAVACVYPDEDRTTVSLGGLTDDLTIFVDVKQLDRLIVLLTAVRSRLR